MLVVFKFTFLLLSKWVLDAFSLGFWLMAEFRKISNIHFGFSNKILFSVRAVHHVSAIVCEEYKCSVTDSVFEGHIALKAHQTHLHKCEFTIKAVKGMQGNLIVLTAEGFLNLYLQSRSLFLTLMVLSKLDLPDKMILFTHHLWMLKLSSVQMSSMQ